MIKMIDGVRNRVDYEVEMGLKEAMKALLWTASFDDNKVLVATAWLDDPDCPPSIEIRIANTTQWRRYQASAPVVAFLWKKYLQERRIWRKKALEERVREANQQIETLGFVPLADGEILTAEGAERAKKYLNARNIDFSRHAYWLVSDNGMKKGFDTLEKALESIQ